MRNLHGNWFSAYQIFAYSQLEGNRHLVKGMCAVGTELCTVLGCCSAGARAGGLSSVRLWVNVPRWQLFTGMAELSALRGMQRGELLFGPS